MTTEYVSRHYPRPRLRECSSLAHSKVQSRLVMPSSPRQTQINACLSESWRSGVCGKDHCCYAEELTLQPSLYQPPLCLLSQLRNESVPTPRHPRTSAAGGSEYCHVQKHHSQAWWPAPVIPELRSQGRRIRSPRLTSTTQ